MSWFFGVSMLLINLAAAGVFTGHTERLLRRVSPGRHALFDGSGDQGCYSQFLKVWAVGVFLATGVLATLVLTGTIDL
ncbi:MAG: hypothetical protein K0R39_3821 [Symbiobacteriaceae bacterium]|jgi:hypothetical protein|nr:hypothetical protein [Symbiobacteriaceae bacterium]